MQPVRRSKQLSRPTVPLRSVSSPLADPPWTDAFELFVAYQTGDVAPGTLNKYKNFLMSGRMLDFLREEGVTYPRDLTAAKLQSFKAQCLEAGMSDSTLDTYIRTVKRFLKWCGENGIEAGDGARVKNVTIDLVEPSVVNPREEMVLLAACRSERDRFMVRFLVRTGLRRGEMLSVKVSDIEQVPGVGHYLSVGRSGGTKSHKGRLVPLKTHEGDFYPEIQKYVSRVRPRDTARDELFLSLRKDASGDYRPLGTEAVKTIFERLGADTGIQANPHRFRHTFITRAVAAGVNPAYIQRAVGHESGRMLERYTHFDGGDVLRGFSALRSLT